MATRIKTAELQEDLQNLVDWELFGIHLPKLDDHDITKISRDHAGVDQQKFALYRTWLELCPDASWNDVILALRKSKHEALAVKIERKRGTTVVSNNKSVVPSNESVVEEIDAASLNESPELPKVDQHEIPLYSEQQMESVINLYTRQKKTEQWEEQKFFDDVDIILHTVNSNEMWAVMKYMLPSDEEPLAKERQLIDVFHPRANGRRITLGMFGGYKCAMIQTKPGRGCHDEVMGTLKICPNAQVVLAIGVAYGRNREKQRLGDVLVSKSIDGIENTKHAKNGSSFARPGDTRMCIVADRLIDVFVERKETWEIGKKFSCTEGGRPSKVHPGEIISATTLVDDEKKRDELLSLGQKAEAIGGEMEGVVLLEIKNSLAKGQPTETPRNVDVMVIKGVADYADGKKEKTWQFTAAMAAADYADYRLKETAGFLFPKNIGHAAKN